jgi:hypothetical protein
LRDFLSATREEIAEWYLKNHHAHHGDEWLTATTRWIAEQYFGKAA